MGLPKRKVIEFEVGKYICPVTKELVPFRASCPLASVVWPQMVRQCESCGQQHVLQYDDIEHPPVFGYE